MELGEGDGELMKMLMQTDQPDENIQRPMEDSAMVQSGVRRDQSLPFCMTSHFRTMLVIRRMCTRLNNKIFHDVKPDAVLTLSVCVGRKRLLP